MPSLKIKSCGALFFSVTNTVIDNVEKKMLHRNSSASQTPNIPETTTTQMSQTVNTSVQRWKKTFASIKDAATALRRKLTRDTVACQRRDAVAGTRAAVISSDGDAYAEVGVTSDSLESLHIPALAVVIDATAITCTQTDGSHRYEWLSTDAGPWYEELDMKLLELVHGYDSLIYHSVGASLKRRGAIHRRAGKLKCRSRCRNWYKMAVIYASVNHAYQYWARWDCPASVQSFEHDVTRCSLLAELTRKGKEDSDSGYEESEHLLVQNDAAPAPSLVDHTHQPHVLSRIDEEDEDLPVGYWIRN